MASPDEGNLDLFGPGGAGAPLPNGQDSPEPSPAGPEEHESESRAAAPAGRGSTPQGPGARRSVPGADTGSAPSGSTSTRARGGPPVWSVSMVNRHVRELIEGSVRPLWISGEVANWTRARSGHCYFTLKDDAAQLRAVMWRSDAQRLPMDPEEGMTVRVFGALTLYEARGEYQLSVRVLEAEGGEGLWRIAFERLRKKLEREGLMDPARKRRLPRFPTAVGIVTSPTGAAIRDVLTVIRRRAPWTRVVVRGARVQGEGASFEVARAIRALGGSGLVEVLIVGRGGGSIEDLWAFNEEPVARAIAECPVPVISAVGHEVDVTIADLVADARAPTPSAGAEAAVQDREALLELLRGVRPRLARGLHRWVEGRSLRLRAREERLHRQARLLVEPRWQILDEHRARMERAVRRRVDARRGWLARAAAKVEALSPLSTLSRGYAVPLDDQGGLLRRTGDFEVGRRFTLRVVDGRIRCEVEGVMDDERGNGAPRAGGAEASKTDS